MRPDVTTATAIWHTPHGPIMTEADGKSPLQLLSWPVDMTEAQAREALQLFFDQIENEDNAA